MAASLRFRLAPVALLASALALSAAARQETRGPKADAWPLFRGNALQTGVATTSLPDELAVRWQFQAKDAFEAAAAIAGDTVYVTCYDEHLYALSLADGKERWKQKIGPSKAPPSVLGKSVFVGTEDGVFFCLDAATGAKRWSFETGGEIISGANFAGDQVLFGSYDGHLYCLNKDGKLVWKVKTEGPVNGSPAVVGRRTFVAGCDSHLHVIDLDRGQQIASLDLEGQAAATAALRGDDLYVGTMTSLVQAVNWKEGKILWTYRSAARPQEFYASAAVTDALVVVGSRDRKVHAIDRQTGKAAWVFPTKGRVDASPVIAGKRVYAPSLDGSLYVLDLATGKQQQKLNLGRGISASPAVAGGCLVVGTTEGVLYCLGKKQ
jgi:outer membrane protein assembly factor BamB